MKYKVTLNGRTYEVEVEAGKAMLLDEYEAIAPAAPAPAAAPAAAAPAAAPSRFFQSFFTGVSPLFSPVDFSRTLCRTQVLFFRKWLKIYLQSLLIIVNIEKIL